MNVVLNVIYKSFVNGCRRIFINKPFLKSFNTIFLENIKNTVKKIEFFFSQKNLKNIF